MTRTNLQTESGTNSQARVGELQLKWIASGFHNPECAVFDPHRGEIYLSCMASDGRITPIGRGYISRLTPDGGVIEKHWITGLQNPCGIAVQNSRLYIADCNRLLVVDTLSGRIDKIYDAPGSAFLDGMAVNEDGSKVFVSDIFGNAIWCLSGNAWEKWLEHPRLNQPDGMVAENDRLVVGGFALNRPQEGQNSASSDWTRAGKGHLVAVDYGTRQITDIGTGAPIANHDGLCSDGRGGYLTSDFISGTLLQVDENGGATVQMYFDFFDEGPPTPKSDQEPRPSCGPADIRYDAVLKTLFVPLLNVGKLAAYSYPA